MVNQFVLSNAIVQLATARSYNKGLSRHLRQHFLVLQNSATRAVALKFTKSRQFAMYALCTHTWFTRKVL